MRRLVLIEVSGGVAECTGMTVAIDVVILDHDNTDVTDATDESHPFKDLSNDELRALGWTRDGLEFLPRDLASDGDNND